MTSDAAAWLELASRDGELPDDAAVQRVRRRGSAGSPGSRLGVRVVEDEVLVDGPGPGRSVRWDGARLLVDGEVVVPWRCLLVVTEPSLDPVRTARLAAMWQRSPNRGAVVSDGCGPLTRVEDFPPGTSGRFAGLLGAMAHADRVAATSAVAEKELLGWRSMLAGIGLAGPQIACPADEDRWDYLVTDA